MPTCRHCYHDVGHNATACPNCGEQGEYWKYDYRPPLPSPAQDAWFELIALPPLIVVAGAFVFGVVYFGIQIVMWIAGQLFALKVNWNLVEIIASGVAAPCAVYSVITGCGGTRGIQEYFKRMPANATLVLWSFAKGIAAIAAIYVFFKIARLVFFV